MSHQTDLFGAPPTPTPSAAEPASVSVAGPAEKHGTNIEWTHVPGYKGETWNPIRGTKGMWHCVRISEGCGKGRGEKQEGGCYAEALNEKNGGPAYKVGADTPRIDATVGHTGRLVLHEPLNWKAPRAIFPCSMTDLYLEAHPFEWIAAVFAVAAACPRHLFITTTKRAKRMLEFWKWLKERGHLADLGVPIQCTEEVRQWIKAGFPALPNVWAGVSAENQQRANERIPLLLLCPAAVRWVSVEPLLDRVDLTDIELPPEYDLPVERVSACINALTEQDDEHFHNRHHKLDWVVWGGETGAHYREMDVRNGRFLANQCAEHDVACFVKQDSGRFPGRQGRIPDDLWAVKQWPAVVQGA